MNDEHSEMLMNSIAHSAQMVQASMQIAAGRFEQYALELTRPFNILKPKIFPDGNQWCVLYGENIQEGVAGFGDTPELASSAFDDAWFSERAASWIQKAEQKC